MNIYEFVNRLSDELGEEKKWIQKVAKSIEKKGTKGALHRSLGIPQGEKIPLSKLKAAASKGGKLGKMAQFALNVR